MRRAAASAWRGGIGGIAACAVVRLLAAHQRGAISRRSYSRRLAAGRGGCGVASGGAPARGIARARGAEASFHRAAGISGIISNAYRRGDIGVK